MTTTRRMLLLAGGTTLAAPAILGKADAQGRITLKLGHLANEQNVWHRASLKLAEEARTLSNGRIDVQVFPNETLGREMDVINGMQLGTADMTITGESLQNWAPLASLLAVPYAVTSIAQMRAQGGLGPVGRACGDAIDDGAMLADQVGQGRRPLEREEPHAVHLRLDALKRDPGETMADPLRHGAVERLIQAQELG